MVLCYLHRYRNSSTECEDRRHPADSTPVRIGSTLARTVHRNRELHSGEYRRTQSRHRIKRSFSDRDSLYVNDFMGKSKLRKGSAINVSGNTKVLRATLPLSAVIICPCRGAAFLHALRAFRVAIHASANRWKITEGSFQVLKLGRWELENQVLVLKELLTVYGDPSVYSRPLSFDRLPLCPSPLSRVVHP